MRRVKRIWGPLLVVLYSATACGDDGSSGGAASPAIGLSGATSVGPSGTRFVELCPNIGPDEVGTGGTLVPIGSGGTTALQSGGAGAHASGAVSGGGATAGGGGTAGRSANAGAGATALGGAPPDAGAAGLSDGGLEGVSGFGAASGSAQLDAGASNAGGASGGESAAGEGGNASGPSSAMSVERAGAAGVGELAAGGNSAGNGGSSADAGTAGAASGSACPSEPLAPDAADTACNVPASCDYPDGSHCSCEPCRNGLCWQCQITPVPLGCSHTVPAKDASCAWSGALCPYPTCVNGRRWTAACCRGTWVVRQSACQ